MLYYFTRKNSDGVETSYVSENKNLATRLRREDEVVSFEALSLKDVEARIRFEEPRINNIEDERYPGAILTKDVSLLEDYFRDTARILKLGEYNPERVEWEEKREENLRRLDSY